MCVFGSMTHLLCVICINIQYVNTIIWEDTTHLRLWVYVWHGQVVWPHSDHRGDGLLIGIINTIKNLEFKMEHGEVRRQQWFILLFEMFISDTVSDSILNIVGDVQHTHEKGRLLIMEDFVLFLTCLQADVTFTLCPRWMSILYTWGYAGVITVWKTLTLNMNYVVISLIVLINLFICVQSEASHGVLFERFRTVCLWVYLAVLCKQNSSQSLNWTKTSF